MLKIHTLLKAGMIPWTADVPTILNHGEIHAPGTFVDEILWSWEEGSVPCSWYTPPFCTHPLQPKSADLWSCSIDLHHFGWVCYALTPVLWFPPLMQPARHGLKYVIPSDPQTGSYSWILHPQLTLQLPVRFLCAIVRVGLRREKYITLEQHVKQVHAAKLPLSTIL